MSHTTCERCEVLQDLGRMLIGLGGGLLLLGVLLFFAGKLFGAGHLPGDILIQRERFTLYIPLGLMIALSVLLTIVLNLIARLRK